MGEATPAQGSSRRRPAPARNAAVAVGVFVAALWVVQIAGSVSGDRLLRFGIVPRTVGRLGDVLSAPFIHLTYGHLLANTVPLVILGFLVALRGIDRFLVVTLVVILASGLGVWITAAARSDTVGASGVVFGYFGYLVARGLVDRHLLDLIVGALVGALYWSLLPDLFPGQRGISWQAHLFGLLGGIAAAWLLRERRPAPAPPTAA